LLKMVEQIQNWALEQPPKMAGSIKISSVDCCVFNYSLS
jgi:DNA polymerase III psi subunit